LSITFWGKLSERLQDHFQPPPVLAVLGRESPEQFLEGGVLDLEEGLEMDLLGKPRYCLGGAKEIIMVNPSALDRETAA